MRCSENLLSGYRNVRIFCVISTLLAVPNNMSHVNDRPEAYRGANQGPKVPLMPAREYSAMRRVFGERA